MVDPVRTMSAILPKDAVSQVVGDSEGKSALRPARMYRERKRDFAGQPFRAGGGFVSTVGRDEGVIRADIKQEQEDQRFARPGS